MINLKQKMAYVVQNLHQHTHTHTQTRLTALCPGQPRWADTRKVKPIWILLKQETVSGSGISWAICKSAPRSRQITTPPLHYKFFTGRMPFLPPNQQCQSTEGQLAPKQRLINKPTRPWWVNWWPRYCINVAVAVTGQMCRPRPLLTVRWKKGTTFILCASF